MKNVHDPKIEKRKTWQEFIKIQGENTKKALKNGEIKTSIFEDNIFNNNLPKKTDSFKDEVERLAKIGIEI